MSGLYRQTSSRLNPVLGQVAIAVAVVGSWTPVGTMSERRVVQLVVEKVSESETTVVLFVFLVVGRLQALMDALRERMLAQQK